MSCSKSSPPKKFLVKTGLVNPASPPCGIDTITNSKLVVEVSNLGNSIRDVYVEAKSAYNETVFVNKSSGSDRHIMCHKVLLPPSDTEPVNFSVKQLSTSPTQDPDAIEIDVQYTIPNQSGTTVNVQSIPNAALTATQIRPQLDLN